MFEIPRLSRRGRPDSGGSRWSRLRRCNDERQQYRPFQEGRLSFESRIADSHAGLRKQARCSFVRKRAPALSTLGKKHCSSRGGLLFQRNRLPPVQLLFDHPPDGQNRLWRPELNPQGKAGRWCALLPGADPSSEHITTKNKAWYGSKSDTMLIVCRSSCAYKDAFILTDLTRTAPSRGTCGRWSYNPRTRSAYLRGRKSYVPWGPRWRRSRARRASPVCRAFP